MATAIRNIAGLALAPLGAFNAPIINSNVRTTHILGTVGAQINTYVLSGLTPLVVAIPSTNGFNAVAGKNVIAFFESANNPGVIAQLSVVCTTVADSFASQSVYSLTPAFDATCPLVMAFMPLDTVGTVTITLQNASHTAQLRFLVYPD